MSNQIILVITVLCIFYSGCKKKQSKEASKPNVVIILADDLGYGDLQSLNPESKIPTPNMDKIVEEGVSFSDAHTNSSVCTPTRYGILTGRYAWRTRLKSGVLYGYSKSLIEPKRETIATLMRKNGYNTACIGKWHLGLDWQKLDETNDINDTSTQEHIDYSKYVNGGPADHGFDYSLIIPASLDMPPYLYVRNGMTMDAPTAYTEGKNPKKAGRGIFWRAGEMAPNFDFYQVLPSFIDSACHYIIQVAKDKNPFFLYLPLPAPHNPWVPTDPFTGKSNAGTYGDFVNMVDHQIGRVMQAIDNAGIDDNTIIIVTSDNGSDWRPTDIETYGHHANYIFKGRKADIYEAGHRVPFIARWKGKFTAGFKSDEILCTTDLLGTMAGMLNQPIPQESAEDSYNMWPAFLGKNTAPIREATVHHSISGFFSIRKGDWKFTPRLGSGGFSKPKNIETKEGEAPSTLYNIKNDPEEKNNLYFEYPDKVKELSALLKKYKKQGFSRAKYNN